MNQSDESRKRRPYRPPIGIPTSGEPRARATVAAVFLHVVLVLALLAPAIYASRALISPMPAGGDSSSTRGGGGGGARLFGGRVHYIQERVGFVRVAPEPEKKPEIVVPKPEVAKPPPLPALKPPPVEPPPTLNGNSGSRADSVRADTSGGGAGPGRSGDPGAGPGRGGGVGSGVGRGRGSGTGPGTGGGDGAVYPPTVIALPILPLPIPAKVRPYKMVARFEVDSTGAARLIEFNPSRDAGYNKRIRQMLLEIRFRPAVTADGRPVAALAIVTAEAM